MKINTRMGVTTLLKTRNLLTRANTTNALVKSIAIICPRRFPLVAASSVGGSERSGNGLAVTQMSRNVARNSVLRRR